MLRNMKVGTKLVAILVAPLVVLGVVAGLGVAGRLGDMSRAAELESLTRLALRNGEALHQLQGEELLASVIIASEGRVGGPELAAHRVVTSEAFDALREEMDAVSDIFVTPGFPDRLNETRAALDAIENGRAAIDSGASDFETMASNHAATSNVLWALIGELSRGITDQAVAADLDTLVTLTRHKLTTASRSPGR